MADRQVQIIISASVEQALRGMRDVQGGLRDVGNAGGRAEQQTSSFGQRMAGALGAAGVVGGIAGIVGGLKSVIDTGLDYEKSIHTFQAVTGASTDVMKQMGDTAKALGNDVSIPGASAQTTAAAMTELAKGGLTAKQSMDAARGTMVLAAAAQIDGAEAATIQANALNTFGLKADQAGRVANVLANVANKSSGEITDFAQGLAQAGTVSQSFGWSIEDTTTMLGLMANAGIKGSDAGTSLKTTMTAMLNPTKQQAAALDELGIKTHDANGNMISAQEFTSALTTAKGKMSQADFTAAAATAFGTDAVRTALVAAQAGTKGYNDMAGALSNATGAQDVAAANAQGFTGALDGLQNAASTAALALYEGLAPGLTVVAQAGTEVANALGAAIGWFTELPGPVQAGALAIGAMVLLNGPLTAMWTGIRAGATSASLSLASMRLSMQEAGMAAGTMRVGLMAASIGVRTLGTAIKTAFLSNPIGIALVAATTALSFFMSSTDDAAESTQNYTDVIDDQTGALKDNAAQLISSKVEASGLGDKWRALGGDTSVLVDAIGKVPGAAEKAQAFLDSVKKSAVDQGVALQGAAGSASDYTSSTQGAAAANGTAGLSFSAGTAALGTQSEGYKTATEAQDLFNQQTGLMNTALDTQKNTAAGAAGELGKVETVTDGAGAAAAEAVDPMKELSDKLKSAADNAQLLADNTVLAQMLGDMKGKADDASRALDLFKIKQDELTGGTRSLEDAQADQATTLTALSDSFKNGTAAATENKDAGNINMQALQDWNVSALNATSDGAKLYDELRNMGDQHMVTAQAAYSDAVAHGNVAGAADAARAAADANRQKFVDLASQYLGGNVPAAEALADRIGIVAGQKIEDKDFKVIADDKQAQDALEAAQAAVIADKTFKITALAGIDQATLDAANAKAVAFGYAPTDYAAIAAGKADGGWVSGPGGPKEDKVAARLSPGEFIVNAAAAGQNKGLLEAINGGMLGFADGGEVPGAATGASAAVAVSGAVAIPDVAAVEAAWAAIAAAVVNAWTSLILPALDALSVATLRTNTEFLALQADSVEPSWAANSAAIANSVDGVILPTYAALNAATDYVGSDQHFLFDAAVNPVWTATGQLISNTWAGPIAGTYAALNAGSNFVGATFGQLAATTAATWGQIGASINNTYTGQVVPAWNGVQGFANSMGAFFGGLQTNVSASATSVTGDLAEITTAIDDFFKLVDGKAPAPATAAAAATVTAGVAAFADGGMLTGPGGPRSDNLLIAASPGEYVVNAAATAKHKDVLDQINYGGAFADGGLVGTHLQDEVTAGARKAIEAGVARVITAMAPTASGFSGPVPAGARGAFLNAILSKQGTEYVWGAAGPDVFDCSGLMSWGLIQAGVGKGRLTAAEFGDNFPRVNPEKPGDMAIFDTGRVSPKAGHIGAVLDPTAGTMMHTDGAGPARISPYRGRSGLMGFIDAIGGDYSPTPSPESKAGDPPAANWLQAMLDKIKTGVTNGAAVGAPGVGAAGMNTVDPIQDFGAQNMARGTMDMVGPVPAGGAEERWRPMVEAILTMKGKPLGDNTTRAMYQMHTESGGDPLAYNDWDRNYTGGHPSKSLWQTIPSTFRRWADPGFNTNIWHPESNFRAASNYVDANYGGIFPGVAYDNGGILPPGITMAYNGTDKNEMHLTNSQWQTARAATLGVGSSGGSPNISITNYVDAAGILSRTEVMVDGKMQQLNRALVTTALQS